MSMNLRFFRKEEKDSLSYKEQHGNRVMKAAWIVELCLFCLAISLALLNIVFALDGEINWVSAYVMFFGWTFIAVIELATIPLAGSLRLAPWKDKPIAIVGLLGLGFLSAYTVYEFNEIASELMTRGARQNSVQVEKIKSNIIIAQDKLTEDISGFDFGKKQIENLKSNFQLSLSEEKERFSLEKVRTQNYYDELISNQRTFNDNSIYRPSELAEKQNIIKQQEALSQKIDDIRKVTIPELKATKKVAQDDFNKIQKQKNAQKKTSLELEIISLEQQENKIISNQRIRENAAKGGIFESKSKKIEFIQEDINNQLEEVQNQKSAVRNEIISLENFEISEDAKSIELEIRELISVVQSTQLEIKNLDSRLNEIDRRAIKRLEDNENVKLEFQARDDEIKKLLADKKQAIAKEFSKHQELLNSINQKFSIKEQAILNGAISTEMIQEIKQRSDIEIKEMKMQIAKIIEETALQYEKTMYFRMASWFNKDENFGFGKLPTKKDYNKALLFIFLPIGIFFSTVSIVLAYLGTGFKYSESLRKEKFKDIEDIEDAFLKLQNAEKNHQRNQELEGQLSIRKKEESDIEKVVERKYQKIFNKETANFKKEMELDYKRLKIKQADVDRLNQIISDLKAERAEADKLHEQAIAKLQKEKIELIANQFTIIETDINND